MENLTIHLPAKNAEGINGKMRAAHIGLRTPDYKATINWYTEKLGFRVIKEWTAGELQLAFLALANDDSFWIEVLSGGITASGHDASLPIICGFQHFCLDVDSVDETLAALRVNDVTVIREPFNVAAIGKRCGFITDLFGNVIEFNENI
jgi:lactoylglutathione lyase